MLFPITLAPFAEVQRVKLLPKPLLNTSRSFGSMFRLTVTSTLRHTSLTNVHRRL